MLKAFKSLIVAILLAAGTQGASAQAPTGIIYDNGSPASDDGFNFSNGGVADDFTFARRSTVTGVIFWGYSQVGGINLQSIDWAIYTDNEGIPTSASLYSGAVTATTSYTGTDADNSNPNNPLSIYEVSFSLPEIVLAGRTTYWLSLGTGLAGTAAGGGSGWVFSSAGVNGSPAVTGNPNWFDYGYGRDNAFQLIGSVAPIPEPSTYALMLVGLAAITFAAKRRRVPANQPTA